MEEIDRTKRLLIKRGYTDADAEEELIGMIQEEKRQKHNEKRYKKGRYNSKSRM